MTVLLTPIFYYWESQKIIVYIFKFGKGPYKPQTWCLVGLGLKAEIYHLTKIYKLNALIISWRKDSTMCQMRRMGALYGVL